jgi:zinc transport system substrate-binding protein
MFLLIIGCVEKGKDARPVVTVSILPQKYWVERIAGDHFDILVMVPPGADSHTYEPTPQDIQKLTGSVAYFRIGYIDFEQTWMNRFEAINPDMEVVNIPEDLELIEEKGHKAGHQGTDPHVWLSVHTVSKILQHMADEFVRLDPARKEYYEANLRSFIAELDTLDRILSSDLESLRQDTMLIYHPALAYLARDYGFVQISIEEDGKPPSPAHMREIVDIARRNDIYWIVVQKQTDPDFAKGITQETGGEVVTIDPYAYNWLDNMKELSRILNQIHKSQK